MEVKDWSATDASNTLLGSINLSEGITTVDQGNDIARAIMGATARQLGRVNAQSSSIASSATTSLSTATGWAVTITGTTGITSFGTEENGRMYVLTFSGALTMTHNASSLILPGAANITTAANDVAIMLSIGGNNWRCVAYQRASGTPIGFTATSTDNAIARYNGTTGKLQNSGASVDDLGAIFASDVNASGTVITVDASVFGNLNVTGTTALAGTVTTTGSASVGGNLDMTNGNITNVSELSVSEINITSPIGATFGGSVLSNEYLHAAANTATPAGGNSLKGVFLGVSGLGIFFGSGAPTLSAAQGSLYLRSDGSSASTRMYVRSGSSTWIAVTTAS